jgi:heat shock protein HtpX
MNRKTRRGVGNAFKTAVLLGAPSALILLVGRLLAGTTGLVIAGIVAFAMNGFAYFYSDKLALRAMRA